MLTKYFQRTLLLLLSLNNVQYPLLQDLDKSIARNYDDIDGAKSAYVETDDGEGSTTVGGGVALRGSFLIDEEGTIRHAVLNDLPLGRNIDEMLRMVDALSHHQKHGEVCPAGWKNGKDAMAESPAGVSKSPATTSPLDFFETFNSASSDSSNLTESSFRFKRISITSS